MNALLSANLSCLEQGIHLLETLPDSLYSKPCPDVFNSTTGGHIRHNVDHYAALVRGRASGAVDYDARERDTSVEKDREAAIRVMRGLQEDLAQLEGADPDQSLKIRMDDGVDSSWSETTLKRELQFLLSHTIHHYALIVSIASRFGFHDFTADFGIAPSTLHYQAHQKT